MKKEKYLRVSAVSQLDHEKVCSTTRTLEEIIACSSQTLHNFHIRTVNLDIIQVFYSPTDAQVNCLKKNIKICIKTGVLM
jgi:hypothetical protein